MPTAENGNPPSVCTRLLMFVDFVLFCMAVALAVTAFATQFWFEAWPVQAGIGGTENSYVHGGYFTGVRSLDYGLGVRRLEFVVYDELDVGASFISRPVWIGCLSAASLGCLFGVVGVIMALLNAVGAGGRTMVAGPGGLFVWSAVAGIFTCIAAVSYAVQYHLTIKENCLLPQQLTDGFTSKDRSSLSYSFYLLLGSAATYALIFIGLLLASVNYKRLVGRMRKRKEKPVVVDGSIMMY